MFEEQNILVSDELLISKIYFIRGENVMIDSDLAGLYGVETRRINEQVKRNPERFPEDFMFQLSNEELTNLMSHSATSSWGGRRKLPYAFTEHGVLMLSSVLNSQVAIMVNIRVIRIYNRLRKVLNSDKDLLMKLQQFEITLLDHNDRIQLILDYLSRFEEVNREDEKFKNRRQVGYRSNKS